MSKPIPLALLLLALATAPAQAAPIAITSKSGPSLLNSRPASIGDRLNRSGDALATRDKSWVAMAFPAVKGSGSLKRNSQMQVQRVGKKYQIKVRGVINIKLAALKNGVVVTKQDEKAQPSLLQVLGPGGQTVDPVAADGGDRPEVIFGVAATPVEDGGRLCVAVEKGSVVLRTKAGDKATITAGFTGCADGDFIAPTVATDDKFELAISPYQWLPGEEQDPGICEIGVAPGNLLRVQGNRGSVTDGESFVYLPIAADGAYRYDYSQERTVEVVNSLGKFMARKVRACEN